jgi:hypothetical protein
MIDKQYLLTDEQVISFITQGYLLIQPELRPGLNEEVCRGFDENGMAPVDFENDPYFERLVEDAPAVKEAFEHPAIEGALVSLLGEKRQNFGWYCHGTRPGGGGVGWHQDDVNVRHHQVRRLMVLYYPQDVTPDMGPTYVVPSTHFWNTPTDRMVTYGNFRNQVALTVPAGTFVFTHYDLWHSASHNTSNKIRYMVKLYVDRLEEPTQPNWNHDPELGDRLARQRFHFDNPSLATPSDYYKERHLRWQAWQHLKGEIPGGTDNLVAVPGTDKLAKLYDIQGYIGDPRL